MRAGFRRTNTNDLALSRIQDAVSDAFQELSSPDLDGIILKDVVINTTDTTISHGLNRNYRGWVIVDKNGSADIWRAATDNRMKDKQIILIASSQVTVSIKIF
jgi:alkyl hydroperoxide reductase subunit AhpF